MKQLILVSILFGVLSCNVETKSSDESVKEQLLVGYWKVQSSEKPFDGLQKGLKFSPDNQVFLLDSQFKTVPTRNKIIFQLSSDTLKIVDFKHHDKFLFQRGTQIFLIQELTDDALKLEIIHPKPSNEIILKNIK